jgi:hypothetical protein
MTDLPYLTTEPREATLEATEAVMLALAPWIDSKQTYDGGAALDALANAFAIIVAGHVYMRDKNRAIQDKHIARYCEAMGPAISQMAGKHLDELHKMRRDALQ